ncbi:MAG: hypothetical protein IKL53_02330 [Lachnospiraceae bacterium]|nr:hypothetical protein [Lachnospiraceae bacterium]
MKYKDYAQHIEAIADELRDYGDDDQADELLDGLETLMSRLRDEVVDDSFESIMEDDMDEIERASMLLDWMADNL